MSQRSRADTVVRDARNRKRMGKPSGDNDTPFSGSVISTRGSGCGCTLEEAEVRVALNRRHGDVASCSLAVAVQLVHCKHSRGHRRGADVSREEHGCFCRSDVDDEAVFVRVRTADVQEFLAPRHRGCEHYNVVGKTATRYPSLAHTAAVVCRSDSDADSGVTSCRCFH